MALKTPQQYIESLRDGRVTYWDGERIDDVKVTDFGSVLQLDAGAQPPVGGKHAEAEGEHVHEHQPEPEDRYGNAREGEGHE